MTLCGMFYGAVRKISQALYQRMCVFKVFALESLMGFVIVYSDSKKVN